MATKLGCPRYFQLPFCSDESLESLLAARAPGDAWREVRAHVAALADGDARKALVLLDAALLDDGPAAEDEVASTTPEAVEPWCPSHDAEAPSITSILSLIHISEPTRPY